MNRREFIKLSALLGAAGSAPWLLQACARTPGLSDLATAAPATTTPTVCNICFWACAGFVHQRDGVPWKIIGHPGDLHCEGRLCTRGTGGLGAYTDPDRLTTPLMRVERNGEQTFEPVSWDEALDFIAGRMREIRDAHGADRIASFSHGSGGEYFRHLLRAFGSDADAHPSYAQCRGPREAGFELTFGEGIGSPDRTDMANSRCIVLIGSHLGENLHNAQVQTFIQAIDRGATVIVVDPRFSVAAGKAHHWLPIQPGTDIALLLAWMNVIVTEGLYDVDYVQRHAYGFDSLAEHVRQFTPEWAYPETGIEPAVIRGTARAMAAAAPATVVHPGRHVTWYGDDTQRSRAIAILAALLGSWGRQGGFYIPDKVPVPSFPAPDYPEPKSTWRDVTKDKYPLAHDAVTNVLIEASQGEDAHYKAWFVYGTNLPITMPGARDMLKSAVEQLDLVVVVDVQPAEITGYADVILPECSYLERYDSLRNSPEREPSLALRMPAFDPVGDSKPAWWMAKQLAERLELGAYFPYEDYTEVLDWQLKQVGSSLEEMQKIGVKRFPRRQPLYFAAGETAAFRTPSGKIELYSHTLADHGHDPLPRYTRPQPVPDGFLRLNYGRVPAHTFGRTINNPYLYELMPENLVWVNPAVAADHGLEGGQYVRLKNQDGVVSGPVRVRITERIRPDSVYLPHGYGHNANKLSLAHGRGADDSSLMTNVPIDPIMGGTGMRANFVTFVKEETA
jgi:thiosulfate reductase/polysulfide reductase chain A